MESPVRGSELIGNDPDFHLIETFGFCPDTGVARRAFHAARLGHSARFFGIPFDPANMQAIIDTLPGDTPLRCRLTLGRDGALDLETAPMPAAATGWRFAIHSTRLTAADPFLRHKTTRRALYNAARNSLPPGVDEWLFLNERGELCEGTITNVMISGKDGTYLTPPLSSGCLPGVFRESLIQSGQLREAVLTFQDLQDAKSVFFTNALRGAVPAQWSTTCQIRMDQDGN